MNLHWHNRITQILWVWTNVYSSIMQSIFTDLKILCALPIYLFPDPWRLLAISFFHGFTFCRMCESFFCPTQHLLPALSVKTVRDFDLSNKYVVVSDCRFNLHFPADTGCGRRFLLFIIHLHISFGKMSVKVFNSFFLTELFVFLWLSFKSSSYILDNNPLQEVSFEIIFSYTVACLLMLLTLSFAERTF